MIVREVLAKEKTQFNSVVDHPLQSWEWGQFRQKTGKRVIRLGALDPSAKKAKLKAGYQLTVHPLPKTNFCLLYFPRGPMPDQTMLRALTKLGRQEKAILVKMEPNVGAKAANNQSSPAQSEVHRFLLQNHCRPGRPFFYRHTFQLDLTKTEAKLMAAMHPKTRYNIRLAQRHGIKVIEDNSDQAYETFIKLFFTTTRRQKFYGHTPDYYRLMKDILVPAKIEHLFLAQHGQQTLAAYIFFTFKDTLYYVYGGSTREGRQFMPTYALMWQAIKFGRKLGLKKFDLWASLGPKADPRNPWYGFHRFKAGFGGTPIEFIGTYDLVINPPLYPVYNLANEIRWQFLKLKARLPGHG